MSIKNLILSVLALMVYVMAFASPGERIAAAEARKLIASGALLIDVRTKEEFESGTFPDSINIPHDQIEARVAELRGNESQQIVLFCRSGKRADTAKATLEKLGFHRVYNVGGLSTLRGE